MTLTRQAIQPGLCALCLAGLLAGPAGCVTYTDPRAQQAAYQREDVLLLQEENRRLTGRVEGLELEIERLQRELMNVRNEQSRTIQSQTQTTDKRVADLERRIAEVDRAREKDKQEIVDRLSKTIQDVMKTSGRPAATTTRSTTRAGTGYGYEHTVGPGQTLSQIAAAYGVSARVIIEANNLQDPDRLRVGQVLFIPE